MLTALALAMMATTSGDDMRGSIQRAVLEHLEQPRAEWRLPVAPRRPGGSIAHRNLYLGILALDWASTELCCTARGQESYYVGGRRIVWSRPEANPLPFMGSSAGRAVTMGALAVGWSVLDRALERERHHRLARAARWTLRHVTIVYAVSQINSNLGVTRHAIGWEPPVNPMSLIPGSWRRD